MKRSLKILYICPLPVYPLNYGGAIYSFSKAYTLVKRGHRVDFVTTKEPNFDYSKFEKIFPYNIYIKKKSRIKSLFSVYPYTFERFKPNRNELNLIVNQVHKEKYDIVIFEYPYSYFFYQRLYNILQSLGIKKVYFSQNIEYLYAINAAKDANSIFYKVFFYLQYLKLKKYEPLFLSKDFDLIFSVSNEETNLLRSYNLNSKIVWLPPIIPEKFKLNGKNTSGVQLSLDAVKKFSYKILFIGGLDIPSNIQAIEWFTNKVMPILRRKLDCCFIVAGRKPNKNSLKSRIMKLINMNNDVFIFFSPNTIEPFYKNSDLVVIPLFNNAGVKIKLIEALKYGKKVVARPEGVYGSGLQNIVPTAETPEEFANKCIDVLKGKIDYLPIWKKFNELYDADRLGDLLENELLELVEK